MRWVDFKDEYPDKDLPFIARAGGYLCLCTYLGSELHITDCEQWQYVFDENEKVEIRGQKLREWLDVDFDTADSDGFYPPPWKLTKENEQRTEAFILGQKTLMQQRYENGD